MRNSRLSDIKKRIIPLVKLLSKVCERVEITGDIRMEMPHVSQVSFLVIPRMAVDLFGSPCESLLAEELSHNVRLGRMTRVNPKKQEYFWLDGQVTFRIIVTTHAAWVTQLFHTSCGKSLYFSVACSAKAKGLVWKPEGGGFFPRQGSLPVFVPTTEHGIFSFVNLPYTKPDNRAGSVVFPRAVSGESGPIPVERANDFVRRAFWVDTNCGGEAHQYSMRNLHEDETAFLWFVETQRTHGYDGWYLGKHYRYLDLGEYFYFTQGYDTKITEAMNRKRLMREPTRWTPNRSPLEILNDLSGQALFSS